MASLISRVRVISNRIRDLEGLKATEAEVNQFKTRADDLSNLAVRIQQPADQIDLFRRKGIAVETPRTQAHQLRLELETMQEAYAKDRKSIIAASSEWRFNTRTGLDGIAKRSNQQLLEAWSGHLSELKPAADSGMLLLLARSTAYQERSRKITDLSAQIDQQSNRVPNTAEDLERPAKVADELRSLISEFPDDIPVPIRQLIQSINEGRATAEQLTGDAMQWLLDNKMLSDLQVSWRPN